jgi:transposase
MQVSTTFDTQSVGALPAICGYFERLDLAATIDRLVPHEGEVSLGALAEILIANRLLRPQALYRIGDWARQAAVTDFYGLTTEQLNDDRLGRALERLAEHADAVQAALVLRAIEAFELNVTQIHYDITSVELYGAYEPQQAANSAATAAARPAAADATGTPPRPAYGRTKSGKRHVKQVQLGLDVTGDGGVPVGHLPLDGNAAESPSHLDNLKRLGQLRPKGPLLYIADTKLDTPANLRAIAARKGHFLCGGAFSPQLKERFLKQRHKLRPVAYWPKSQDERPASQRDQYKAFEVPELLTGTVAGRPVRLRYRLVFVWSESKARQEAATRERHTAKITEEFEAVRRNLNRYSLKTREAAVRRLEGACGRYAEGALFRYELTQGDAGALALSFRLDGAALLRWRQLEGLYVLKTDVRSRALPLAEVLRGYRGQSAVERRFHHLKGPLAVAPVFLKSPERIAGLLCVLVWALMVLALMERQVRRKLQGKPLVGLYPEGRPSAAPTGPALLECFSGLCVVVVRDGMTATRHLAQPTAVQQRLLQLLDLPPSRLRAFKRRCGVA